MVTRRERAELLALVCDVYCDFVTFLFGILGQVWYLLVSIPDPCRLSYLCATHFKTDYNVLANETQALMFHKQVQC